MKARRPTLRVLGVAVLCVGGWSTASAQATNSGDIRGTVTDPSGALIPDVTVTVVNLDTGITKVFDHK